MKKIRMPKVEISGFVPTLNKTGYMTSGLDEYSQAFVDSTASFAGQEKALEVGAAYGVSTLEVLGRGQRILANDLDQQHLEILRQRAQKMNVKLDKLETVPGDFLSVLDDDRYKEKFSSLLCCRVLHFLKPSGIEKAFSLFAKLLEPGGLLHIVNETCYLKNFQGFIPTYEKLLAQKGVFAGFIEDVKSVDPNRGKNLPEFMTFFDVDTLEFLAEKYGFKVIKCGTFARPEFPEDIRLDGRESVGLIAQKI